MSESFVVIWRPSEGAAVATYSLEDKSPRVFTDPSAPEVKASEAVTEEELEALLASRETFEYRRVPTDVAERLLGWTVTNG